MNEGTTWPGAQQSFKKTNAKHKKNKHTGFPWDLGTLFPFGYVSVFSHAPLRKLQAD